MQGVQGLNVEHVKYNKEQVRAGKHLVWFFIGAGIEVDEAKRRTVDILAEHPPERVMRALADKCIEGPNGMQNLYKKLNYAKERR